MEKTRNEKGRFVKKTCSYGNCDEDIDVTFPLPKEEEKKEVKDEKIKDFVLESLQREENKYKTRMEIMDREFDAHVKRRKLIDWLMIIMLSALAGYWIGISLVVMFK